MITFEYLECYLHIALQTGPSGTSFRALGNAGGGGTLARGSGGQSETAKKDWQVVKEERLKLTRVRKPLPDWGTVDDSDDY